MTARKLSATSLLHKLLKEVVPRAHTRQDKRRVKPSPTTSTSACLQKRSTHASAFRFDIATCTMSPLLSDAAFAGSVFIKFANEFSASATCSCEDAATIAALNASKDAIVPPTRAGSGERAAEKLLRARSGNEHVLQQRQICHVKFAHIHSRPLALCASCTLPVACVPSPSEPCVCVLGCSCGFPHSVWFCKLQRGKVVRRGRPFVVALAVWAPLTQAHVCDTTRRTQDGGC